MTTRLVDLKPSVKYRVMDLVAAAGFDVSDWANFEGGPSKAAVNPRYCYEWCFSQANKPPVVNLWYRNLKMKNGKLAISFNLRPSIQRHLKARNRAVWAKRAERLDALLQRAFRKRSEVRVIINDGIMRDSRDPSAKASRVTARFLDEAVWRVNDYDSTTGKCSMTRTSDPGHYVDQFSLPDDERIPSKKKHISSVFSRSSVFRGFAHARAGGKCEYCNRPGFRTMSGKIYLETHHVVPLSEGGKDSIHNVAAICADHHREAHHGTKAATIRKALLKLLNG